MYFSGLAKQSYLNLETFKKSGEGVKTPVWFAAEPADDLSSASARLYIYTVDNTGKVKRMRNNSKVRVAPCDARGKVLGEWVEARAESISGDELAHANAVLNKKYFPLRQIMGFFALFRRQGRAYFVIRPATSA
jgi:PPOX class probable F420-dependent enzyme